MKFSVLALDYDGTIARDSKTHVTIADAIRDARRQGIVLVLVTGRVLSDLRWLLKGQDLFDVIVAENGAVIEYSNGRTRKFGGPPPQEFLDELAQLKVGFRVGDCVVEADASAAPEILELITKLQLPLTLTFNRSRVMVLPQGITKATGLRETLKTLRLSLHNCIGIGDAENDYLLLDACEIGVAVGWGSSSLKKIADDVLEGPWPEAIADYIRRVAGQRKLPPKRVDYQHILLGHTGKHEPIETVVRGYNVLVAGDPRSGKSWITGLICEQLILYEYCLCVIDPEGDYATLESLPNVVVLGGDDPPPRWRDVERMVRYPDVSMVIDLSRLDHEKKAAYVTELLPKLASLRRHTGLPHWIVVDEAHYFLEDCRTEPPVDLDLASYLFITYRPSQLCSELVETLGSVIASRCTDPGEVKALATISGGDGLKSDWATLLGSLEIGEAALLLGVDWLDHVPQRFTTAQRITMHVRHRAKYLDVPMPKRNAFVFTDQARPVGTPARTLEQFVTALELLPIATIDGHAKRGDFSRWIGDVFGDQPLAVAIGQVEEQYRLGHVADLAKELVRPIRERYGLGQ
jgi:hydroxymethylpyrimidine pyrophosphatase-like HAD family hydrolase